VSSSILGLIFVGVVSVVTASLHLIIRIQEILFSKIENISWYLSR
jgi:hypothetical protein